MNILASDYDGTFNLKGISKANIEAVKRYRAAGNMFGFVTGRCLDMILKEVTLFNIPFDFIIGCSGGIVYLSDKSIMKVHYIDYESVNEVIKSAYEINADYIGMSDGKKYMNIKGDYRGPLNIFKSIGFKILSIGNRKLNKNNIVGIFVGMQPASALKEKLSKLDVNVNMFVNKGCYLDVVAPKINKGIAVADFAKEKGVKEIYVIGDSLNDLSMIEMFKGFCVDNADPEVKVAASMQFSSVDKCINYLLDK